jgi:hypothetical protein
MKTDHLNRALVQDLATPAVSVARALWRTLPVAGAIMAGGFLTFVGVRPDLLAAGMPPTVMKLALGAVLITAAFTAAVKLSRPDQPSRAAVWLLVMVPALAALCVAAELFTSGADNWSTRILGHSFWACLTIVPLLAMVPLAGALHALRNGAPVHPETVGGLAGVGSAGVAILAYGLFCTEDSALFIATWYVLASVIAGLVGALAGRFALRW